MDGSDESTTVSITAVKSFIILAPGLLKPLKKNRNFHSILRSFFINLVLVLYFLYLYLL
jgi:hypothetical protein